ncbi:MAG: hypothetical protein NTY45_15320 [Elusimicrobia bacterium]|nr:hypothetical protein [Elusimicrobiota bacterium]
MEPERERPEMQPMPAPSPGERAPMPAGPGSGRRPAGEKSGSRIGLAAAAAILTAGLAAALVFKGEPRQAQQAAQQAAPEPPAAVQVVVPEPLSKAPPEPASFVLPGSLPAEAVKPAPDSFSSPLPFFSSGDSAAVPKVSALQPLQPARDLEPAQRTAAARTVLPAAGRLTPRLQPAAGGQAGVARGFAGIPRGLAAAAAAGQPCTACDKGAVTGARTRATLQGGEGKMQREISTVYAGVCEGKYVYEYTNLTSNKTIGMKVVTSGGETWTFTLRPGEKTSLKSSTEFNSGTFETYRLSEVMN